MALTPAQNTTLKNAINADPTLSAQPNTSDGNFEVARLLNLEAAPAFVVWQDKLTPSLARKAIMQGATQIDGLTPGKRDELFFIVAETVDCNLAHVRNAIDDACGSANTLKGFLQAATKRNALLIEKILATGTGTTAAPATLGFSGHITPAQVTEARSS